MVDFLVSAVTGAVTAAVFYGTGFLAGRRARKTAGPPAEICQCGHGSAYHDRAGCHRTVKGQILKYDAYADPIKWEIVECQCVRYVGPLSSYVPELDGDPQHHILDHKEN